METSGLKQASALMEMPELETYSGEFSEENLASLYERMMLIRLFEERVLDFFSSSKLSGTTHAYIGQEAVAAGVFAHLTKDDVIVSNHRCHGHYLMHQDDPFGLFCELMGKADGPCGGRGGSQHLHKGNFYTNGVQGGTVPLAAGAALAEKLKNSGNIVTVFMGDGTLGEGQVYETLNMASLWQLPILFVVENNYWAQSTPCALNRAGKIADRFRAFAIETEEVTSSDVLCTQAAAGKAIARVREGIPQAVVFNTFRFCHHSKADDNRPQECIEPWLAHDPLKIAAGRLPQDIIAEIEQRVRAKLSQAEAQADAAPSASVAFSEPLPMPEPCTKGEEGRIAHVLRQALNGKMAEDERVVVLGEDIRDPYGGSFKVTKGLSEKYPERVFTTPISEASMTGIACGLALRGMRPVLEIMFGDFITLCLDQLINYVSKLRGMYSGGVSCPLVLRTPMGGRRGYGPTHSQTLDKFLLGIPDVRLVAISPVHDPGAMLVSAINDDAPVVFIENKLMYTRPVRKAEQGRMGDWFVREGQGAYPVKRLSLVDFASADCTLVTYGGMTELAMEAAEQLLIDEEVVCDLVVLSHLHGGHCHEIEDSLLLSRGRLVTAEEGIGTAGIGSEIIASMTEAGLVRKAARVCAKDSIIPAALHLEKQVLPGIDEIIEAVLRLQ
ncbi:MAG: pyruvate dehydrogenase [bacterium]|nr:pyruvate dehydrogenase [bacterium]